MHVTLKARPALGLLVAAALLGAPAAQADPAYIAQVPSAARVPLTSLQAPANAVPASSFAGPAARAAVPLSPSPMTALGSGGNSAQTLQIGAFNRVAQLQGGGNNASAVGVVGVNNNVGVLQAGNNLRSNVMVVGSGANVGVIQPNGSAPVNMFIARVPNGTVIVRR